MTSKENLLRVIKHDHPAWVPNGTESVVWLPDIVGERPKTAGKDAFGVMWDLNPKAEGGTFPARGGNTIDDIANWRDQLHLPDLDALDWEGVAKWAATIDRDENMLMPIVHMGLFERSYLLLGMEEALICYMIETDEMREMLHAIADYKIALIDHYMETCHPEILWYGDDWGTQTGLFMRPDIWRKTIGAETARIYKHMKQYGVLVCQHSCGKIEAVFGDLVAMGADIWHPCQPCNDLAALKRKYGDRICFMGGIDSQHVLNRPGATPEEVDAEVKRRIDELATGGGYIAAPSHNVPSDEVLLNAMNNAIKKYGRYDMMNQ